MTTATWDAEVIVVGTGPVGSALAALLADRGIDCLRLAPRPDRAGPGPAAVARALALTPASRNILQAAGAWACLPAAQIGCFRKMRVWDAAGSGLIEFDAAELCRPTLGYVVAQADIEQALERALAARRTVETVQPGAIESLEVREDRVRLRFADGGALAGRLLVGADGLHSRVRALAGIDYPLHGYAQHALCCAVETGEPHRDTARQRFLGDGPLAFLPLAGPRHCAVIWSTSPEHARALLALDSGAFEAELAAAFDGALGRTRLLGARAAFPLARAQAERYCRLRVALAGDAAHCVHPLAGQGANLGLLDAASLAEVLAQARLRGRDVGSLPVLRRYERWRRGENAAMILALDALQRLFGARAEPVRRLRNAGLDLVDASGPVKRLVMRLATGTLGDLPAPALEAPPA